MWTHAYSRTTTTPPDLLWRVLADVAAWGTWNQGIETIAVHGQPATGTTFDMTPPDEETVTSTIIGFEEPHVLTDLTELDGVSISVEHRIAPGPDDTSTISFTITVTGEVPDAALADIGTAVSADFDDVISSLDRRARSLGAVDPATQERERP